MTIKLIADSSACMPKKFMDKEGIGYLQQKLVLDNGKEFKELTDLNREDFIKELGKFKIYPKTAYGSPSEAMEVFEKAIEEGHNEILYIGVSPKLSSQINSAKIASKKLKDKAKITLYESGLSTASQGSLIYIASKLLKKGESVSNIIKQMDKYREQIYTVGASTSFDELFKTGKIQKKLSISIMSKVLRLKPMFEIVLHEGARGIGASSGFKGALNKAIAKIDENMSKDIEYDLILSKAGSTKFFNYSEEKVREILKIKDVIYWETAPVVVHSLGTNSIQITVLPHID
ncbi:MAG: DegV family protein [Candidatus Heimdallarchaeaceae archaeon]